MRAATIIGCAAVLTVTGMATAAPIQKGATIFAIQLTEGTGDFAGGGSGTIGSSPHSEVGIQAQFWHFMTGEYAVNFAAGIGYFKETDTQPLFEDYTLTANSWQVRLGGDRVAHLNDRFHLFVGPGIQVWGGKLKTKGSLTGESEGPSSTRFALSGRLGAHLKMGESFGMMAQLGHYWGYATADLADDPTTPADDSAKAKWLPSGHDGAAGFSFNF